MVMLVYQRIHVPFSCRLVAKDPHTKVHLGPCNIDNLVVLYRGDTRNYLILFQHCSGQKPSMTSMTSMASMMPTNEPLHVTSPTPTPHLLRMGRPADPISV